MPQGLLYIGIGGQELKCTIGWGGKNLKHDGTASHPKEETYCSDPSWCNTLAGVKARRWRVDDFES